MVAGSFVWLFNESAWRRQNTSLEYNQSDEAKEVQKPSHNATLTTQLYYSKPIFGKRNMAVHGCKSNDSEKNKILIRELVTLLYFTTELMCFLYNM